MLISRSKDFHEFVLTILPRSLFNTFMDLTCSAFVTKLFISNDSLILHLCMLSNFANVFGAVNSWKPSFCKINVRKINIFFVNDCVSSRPFLNQEKI